MYNLLIFHAILIAIIYCGTLLLNFCRKKILMKISCKFYRLGQMYNKYNGLTYRRLAALFTI
jgi:hypothetical protein